MSTVAADAGAFSGSAAEAGGLGRGVDQGLRVVLALWAAASVLPVGMWVGIADWPYYWETWRFWLASLGLAGLATGLVLVLSHGGAAAALRTLLARVVRMPARLFLAGVGVLALVEGLGVALWCFARNPQAIDGWVQFFQARIFLSGHATAPAPPSLAHFGTLHMLVTEHGWFSHFPPVHSALLALGMALGAAWLVTPLLGGLLPVAVYHLGRRTGDERIARTAAVLTLLSPFVVGMEASAMNHVPAALCIVVGLWTLPDVARGRLRAAAVLGLATGLCLGIRPLDAIVLAAVGAGAVLAALRARAWNVALVTAAAGLAAALPTFAFNVATTGHALRFAYVELWGPGLELGFHATPWGEALTPARALGLTALDAHQMNVFLLEWPLPVAVLVACGVWLTRGTLDAGLRASAAYLALLVLALFLYFHRDTLYGPRLLFSAVPAVVVLTAAGLVRLTDVRRRLGWRDVAVGDAALVFVLVTGTLAATLLVPTRVASFSTIGTSVALHPDEDAARAGIRHAVVVLREGWGPRLIARLWDLGVPMRDSSRLYRAFNACELETRLGDAERAGRRGPALLADLEAAAPTADPGITAPDVVPDRLIRLPSNRQLSPACVAEIERDRQGTMQFPAYLHLNAPTLDGDVVWARDLGDRNTTLQRLYPDRPLYRYELSAETGRTTFVRLAEPISR